MGTISTTAALCVAIDIETPIVFLYRNAQRSAAVVETGLYASAVEQTPNRHRESYLRNFSHAVPDVLPDSYSLYAAPHLLRHS